jgi:threonine aldolase
LPDRLPHKGAMIFASDNWAGASDRVIASVAGQARIGGPAYGGDPVTAKVARRFSEIFEREVAVFFVATGTAANALGLSAYARPGGIVFCHREAHIVTDEAGATEFFSGGTKTFGLDGANGKIAPETLTTALGRFAGGGPHAGRPVAVSLTNLTEIGTRYSPAEVAAIAETASAGGLAVHMDGARFANAVAANRCAPADLTWRAGVDVLSFGGTKNGCIAADAVVFFDPADARDFAFARQRAGHTFSKSWFVAAQFEAYLDDGHWLELASHANGMAARLAAAVEASGRGRLAVKPAGNEVLAIIDGETDRRLREAGAVYYPWPSDCLAAASQPKADEILVRLVASFRTTAEEIDRFTALLKG